MGIVVLKTFDNYFSANIWLTRLQDAGIHCFLLDENTVTIDPILTNAIGGIKLAVSQEDEPTARDMLLAFEQEYRRSARCPRCGSDQFLQVPKRNAGNMLTAVLTWLFSSFAISAEQVYQCQQCSYESDSLPDTGQTELN